MTSGRFDVVVHGLLPGADPQQARARVARGFNIDEPRAAAVVAEGTKVLWRGVDHPTTARIMALLNEARVRAEARPQGMEGLVAGGEPQAPPAQPASPSAGLSAAGPAVPVGSSVARPAAAPAGSSTASPSTVPAAPSSPGRPTTPSAGPSAGGSDPSAAMQPSPFSGEDSLTASDALSWTGEDLEPTPQPGASVAPPADPAPTPARTRLAPSQGIPDLLGPPPAVAPLGLVAGTGPSAPASPTPLASPAPNGGVSGLPSWMEPEPQLIANAEGQGLTGGGPVEQFLEWSARDQIPHAGTPPFQEIAGRLFEAAGSGPVTAEVTDSVLWREERAGAPEHRIRLIRAVGEAVLRFEQTTGAASRRAAVGGRKSGRPTVDQLRSMLDGWVTNVRRRSSREPRLAECRTVVEVAPLCPASHAGVKRGDQLISVNLTPAVSYSTEERYTEGPVQWEVYSQERKELIQFTTNGVPMGMRLGPTAASAEAGYKMSSDDLMSLWEIGEYDAVYNRAQAVVGRTTGFFGKRGDPNQPEYPLLGAAMIERGQVDEGYEILSDYLESYASNWTLNYAGLALYYFARQMKGDDQARAVGTALKAYECYKCEPIIGLVEELTGERPPLRPQRWLGERFPVDYHLPILGSTTRVSFQAVIEQMADHQLLAVCSMNGYRSNGPYTLFMTHYHRCVMTLKDLFFDLHVATSREEVDESWLTNETFARDNGVSINVLYDPEDLVAEGVSMGYCPYVVAVDNQGRVRGENIDREIDLWNGLVNFSSGLGDG